MDGIGVDVHERDWMARPLRTLGTSDARLMDEHFVNRHHGYWNRGGSQCSEISSNSPIRRH